MVDLVTIGIAVILGGILVVFLATFLGARSKETGEREARTDVKGGGVVLIGPIPVIFGSDARWASIAILLAIILVLLSLLLTLYGGR